MISGLNPQLERLYQIRDLRLDEVVRSPELRFGHNRMAKVTELRYAAPIDSQPTRFQVVKIMTLIVFVTDTENLETGAAGDE